MPLLMSSDYVWCARSMQEWYARYNSIVCAFQGLLWQATPHVVWSCVFSKVYDGIARLTSSDPSYSPRAMMVCQVEVSDRVCNPRTMMACHAWHCPLMCIPRAMMACHTPLNPTVCVVKGRCCKPHPMFRFFNKITVWVWWKLRRGLSANTKRLMKQVTFKFQRSCITQSKSSDGITTPNVVRPCVLSKGNDGNTMPNVFWLYVLSKGDDGMPCPT